MTVIPMPGPGARAQATRLYEGAREDFIAEFLAWLRHARPTREEAELEAEGVAATLRQLTTANTRGGAT